MLTLKNCAPDTDGNVRAEYVATQPAKTKDEAPFAVAVTLVALPDGATAHVQLEASFAAEEEAAFDALAESLEKAAAAIRGRGQPKLGVPVYG